MHKRKIFFLLAVLILFLASCSSVPLSTMRRLRNFSENGLSTIDPNELRVRVIHHADLNLKPEGTRISVGMVKNLEHTDSFEFVLQIVERDEIESGWLRKKKHGRTTLKFKGKDIGDFIKLQKNAKGAKDKYQKTSLGVYTSFKDDEKMKGVTELVFSIEVKLNGEEEYFTLIDNVKVKFPKAKPKEEGEEKSE